MRIAEIAILSPSAATQDRFIRTVCPEVDRSGQDITIGRLPINDDLMLYLYGITLSDEGGSYSWDLLFKKMLGYVMVFDWFDEKELAGVTQALDDLTARYEAPLVIAADVVDQDPPASPDVINGGITLSSEAAFLFCRGTDPRSVSTVLAALVNTALAKME